MGGSLQDTGNMARENFVSEQDAAYFARLYRQEGLRGGHIILLNPVGSEFYEATKAQALEALQEYPGGLQVGGGITPDNAAVFLEAGASHVIVTSYVFSEGRIRYDRLEQLCRAVGKKHLVLDLSCRKAEHGYMVVTDRWQNMTAEQVNEGLLERLSGYCDEFLVHAVDVEGKSQGIEMDLVKLLGQWNGQPVTYAGGVHSFEDLQLLKAFGKDRLNVTIGSALDLFGGAMEWESVLKLCRTK